MKSIIIKFLFLIFNLQLTFNCFSQWVEVESGTRQNLNSVYFVDSTHGWVVGDYGIILKYINKKEKESTCTDPELSVGSVEQVDGEQINPDYIDYIESPRNTVTEDGRGMGGMPLPPHMYTEINFPNAKFWVQASHTIEHLNSVHFTDQKHGWVVGNNGTILKYNGKCWEPQISGTKQNLHSVYFIDNNNGWAVGDSGIILKYDGKKWKRQKNSTIVTLSSLYFKDITHGWAYSKIVNCIEGITYNEVILRYNGKEWKKTNNSDRSIYIAPAYNLDPVKDETILLNKIFKERIKYEYSNITNSGWGYSCIYFLNRNEGWAVGWNSKIIHTVNGGNKKNDY